MDINEKEIVCTGIISESWRKNKWKIYRILFSFRTKFHFRVKIKFKEIHTCIHVFRSFNLFIANFVSIYKCTKKFFILHFQLIFHHQKITLFQLIHNSEIPSQLYVLIDAGQFFTGVTKD